MWIGNAPADPEEKDAAPDPLTTVVGISFPIRFTGFFSISPELRYFGHPYGVEYGRPVPVEMEFRDWTWVFGLLLEPRAVFDFRITESLSMGGYISPSFLFRIPGRVWGEVNRGEIVAYHYGMGRFFYPQAGLTLSWKLPFDIRSEKAESLNEGEFTEPEPYDGIAVHLVVDLSAYFPLFHAWDGEQLHFYDQLMSTGVVGLRFFLPSSNRAGLSGAR